MNFLGRGHESRLESRPDLPTRGNNLPFLLARPACGILDAIPPLLAQRPATRRTIAGAPPEGGTYTKRSATSAKATSKAKCVV